MPEPASAPAPREIDLSNIRSGTADYELLLFVLRVQAMGAKIIAFMPGEPIPRHLAAHYAGGFEFRSIDLESREQYVSRQVYSDELPESVRPSVRGRAVDGLGLTVARAVYDKVSA